MPQLGETVTEGMITRWLKRVGEHVDKYEPFAEVATDKVNAEIPSPVAGTLLVIHIAEGETVPTGTVIAEIGNAQDATEAREIAARPEAPAVAGRRAYSPAVRRASRASGIDPDTLQGTGAGGRVTLRDIETVTRGASTFIPLTRARHAIAAHMVESVRTIPHAWTMIEADVTGLLAKRKGSRATPPATPFHYFSYEVVQALTEHPLMNARFTPDAIELFNHVDLSFAIALPESLVVPVVHSAEKMDFPAFARAMAEVTERARNGRLSVDELHGGTITVNNTGANGSILSAPIIHGGQGAIITMEAIVKRPVVVQSEAIAIRSMMNICCSIDHRLIDGNVVGAFLRDLKKRLERLAP
jgi:2-oxoisovalerate dehydrogenase E2 component (dihydrolipoyl transacylase)